MRMVLGWRGKRRIRMVIGGPSSRPSRSGLTGSTTLSVFSRHRENVKPLLARVHAKGNKKEERESGRLFCANNTRAHALYALLNVRFTES
jgi:hypothetical protein